MQATIEQAPILMSRDNYHLDLVLKAAKGIEAALNEVVKQWNALHIGPLTPEELNGIINSHNPEPAVRIRMTEGAPRKVGKLEIDTDAFRKLIAIPDLSDLRHAVASVHAALKARSPVTLTVEQFMMQGDKVELREEEEKRITDRYSVYAKTPEEIEIYTEMLQITDRLNELCSKYQGLGTIYRVLLPTQGGWTLNVHGVAMAALTKQV